MSDDPASLRALGRVTGAALQAAQGRMAALAAEEAAIRRAMAMLVPRSLAQDPQAPDPATRAGADMRWQVWAATRREALMAELARLRVRQEAARAELALAFGRDLAAARLVERAAAERTAERARQAALRDPGA